MLIESGSYKLKGEDNQLHISIANSDMRQIISRAFDVSANEDKHFQVDDLDGGNIQVCMIDLKSKSPIKCKKVKTDE